MTDPWPMDEHAGALAPDSPPARVLVVEDDETVAEVLREVLQEKLRTTCASRRRRKKR